jgi:hypothetical protein
VRVIISDIDGTVLDVEPRIVACLNEIGAEYSGEAIRVSRTLPSKQRDAFYDVFLSQKYLHLDRPIPRAVEELRELQASTGLPLVYLSGRLANMAKGTRAALEKVGLPFEAMVLRPMRDRMMRTDRWKIGAIRECGYEPVHIFDDDGLILEALSAAFPAAVMHDLSGPKAVPGGG